MSIKVMTQVWELELPPTEKLVLLVLADHANEDGSSAWPSVETISRKSGLSERSVQYKLRTLREGGLIVVTHRASRHRPTEYRVQGCTPCAPTRGAEVQSVHPGVQVLRSKGAPVAPEPSLNRPNEPSLPSGARTHLKNALLEACGYSRESVTSPQWGAIENAAKNLADVGASPAEVLKRARLYRSKNPEWKLTPSALAKWWSDLSPASGTPRGSAYTR